METLDDINKLWVDKLMPNIVWMFVCLFIGVLGNTLVLLVYRLRLKTEANERFFIPILAFLDLLASALSSLHGLLNYIFYANYPSDALCKFLNFGSFFTSAASAHTLLLIAIQRYRKICVPLGRQMDLFWKRLSFGIVIFVSLSYSLPICYVAGLTHFSVQNFQASLCAIDSGDYPVFYKVYYSGVFLFVLSNIVAVIVLYSKIGCFIYKRGRSGPGRRTGRSIDQSKTVTSARHSTESKDSYKTSDSVSQPSTGSSTLSSQGNQTPVTLIALKQINTDEQTSSSNVRDGNLTRHKKESTVISETSAGEGNNKVQINKKEQKTAKWDRTKVNFNKMFGAIILFYLISYVPTLILFVGVSFGGFYGLDRGVFVFVNRLYIINHIVNPFVYGYFDFSFRHSVKSLLKCGK